MSNIFDYERMAMLELTDKERGELSESLNTVLSSFSELDKYDASNVLPLVSVLDAQNVMREDETSKTLSREDLLKNAPEQQDGYVRVPAIID